MLSTAFRFNISRLIVFILTVFSLLLLVQFVESAYVDPDFDPNVNYKVDAFAIQDDGKIIIWWEFSTVWWETRIRIARLHPDGSVDMSFNQNLSILDSLGIWSILIQDDGKIIIWWSFDSVWWVQRSSIARLYPDGSVDMWFNPSVGWRVHSMILQESGSIILWGDFWSVSWEQRRFLARVNADGSLDMWFHPGPNQAVLQLVEQDDGNIIVWWLFSAIWWVSRNRLARLDKDGALEVGFNPNVNNIVDAIALQENGQIILWWQFTNVWWATRNRIARIHSDGSLDSSFNPNANSAVLTLAVQEDGKILLWWNFTTIWWVSRNRLARLHPDWSLDNSFQANANADVLGITLQDNGDILVWGVFSFVWWLPRNSMVRLIDSTIPESDCHALQPDASFIECDPEDVWCSELCELEEPACVIFANWETEMHVDVWTPVLFTSTVVWWLPDWYINFWNGYALPWEENVWFAFPSIWTYQTTLTVVNPLDNTLQATCQVSVEVTPPAVCGNWIAEPWEECGEPWLSCAPWLVCNQASCTCHAYCPLVSGAPEPTFLTHLNFGDWFDTPIDWFTADHTYMFPWEYTATFSVLNPWNPDIVVHCSEDVTVLWNLCGNGDIDPGEECGEPWLECDEWQICNPSTCTCQSTCDEVLVEIIEECDDGMHCVDLVTSCTSEADCSAFADSSCLPRSGTWCTNECTLEFCGDGTVQPLLGEECDEWPNNWPWWTCTNRCTFPWCGDGVVQDWEDCDPWSFCDDGTNCTFNPYLCPWGLAECRPRDTATCTAECTNVPRCGDGVIQVWEECDLGDDNAPDGQCTNECTLTFCGDGIVQSPNWFWWYEQCDERYCDDAERTVCTADDQCAWIWDGLCRWREWWRCDANCQEIVTAPIGACSDVYFGWVHADFPEWVDQRWKLCLSWTPQLATQADLNNLIIWPFDPENYQDIEIDWITYQVYTDWMRWYWKCDLDAISPVCMNRQCWDGIVQEWEECDDGNQEDGDGCSADCRLEPIVRPQNEFGESCIDNTTALRNWVLPLAHNNELLPVWWEVDTIDEIITWDSDICDETTQNTVLGSSLQCTFTMRWASNQFTYTFQLPCNSNIDARITWDCVWPEPCPSFLVNNQPWTALMESALVSKWYSSTPSRSNLLWATLLDLAEIAPQGEIDAWQYLITLDEVSFDYCARIINEEWMFAQELRSHSYTTLPTTDDEEPICESKVSISPTFLTQQWAILQESPNTPLWSFRNIDGVEFIATWTPLDQDLATIAQLNQEDRWREWLFSWFINNYLRLAVTPRRAWTLWIWVWMWSWWTGQADIYKVPNDSIYFYRTVTDNPTVVDINTPVIQALLSAYGVSNFDQPFTLVFPDEHVTVNISDNLWHNGTYIAAWDISFNPRDCNQSSAVQWLFITNWMFTAESLRNTRESNWDFPNQRCSWWSLAIVWALVWEWINSDFANKRRSTMSAWSDSGLFDDSLAWQAWELFNVCYLPNLMEFALSPGSNPPANHAQPVVLESVETWTQQLWKYKSWSVTLEDAWNVCTVASFEWWKEWINALWWNVWPIWALPDWDPDGGTPTNDLSLYQCTDGWKWELMQSPPCQGPEYDPDKTYEISAQVCSQTDISGIHCWSDWTTWWAQWFIQRVLTYITQPVQAAENQPGNPNPSLSWCLDSIRPDILCSLPSGTPIPSTQAFRDYANGRVNYWVMQYIQALGTQASGIRVSAPWAPDPFMYEHTWELILEQFSCPSNPCILIYSPVIGQTVWLTSTQRRSANQIPEGFIQVPVKMHPSDTWFQRLVIYKPVWDQAHDQLVSFFDPLKTQFTWFGKIVEGWPSDTAPVWWILGALRNINRWDIISNFYFDLFGQQRFVNTAARLVWSTVGWFRDQHWSFIDFSRINWHRALVSAQNRERSSELFEWSSVLLQLNTTQWTNLSPWLRSYLEQTIIAK